MDEPAQRAGTEVTIEISGPAFWVKLTVTGNDEAAKRAFEGALRATLGKAGDPPLLDVFDKPSTGERA